MAPNLITVKSEAPGSGFKIKLTVFQVLAEG